MADILKGNFEKDGYVLIPGVLSIEEVEEINVIYQSVWLELIQNGTILQTQERPMESLFPRLHDYHKKYDEIFSVTVRDKLFGIMEQFMGEEALLISSNYFFKAPGSGENPLHQDNYSIGVAPGTTYAGLIYLDDADKQNGCLCFVPGTQHNELEDTQKKRDNVVVAFSDHGQQVDFTNQNLVVEVEGKAGDMVVFNGNIIHGSYVNQTQDRFRRTLLNFYGGVSMERITMNFNQLYDRKGNRVRRRLNVTPKITEGERSVFAYKSGNYYQNNGWQ